jgi:hypothetical protein
LLGQTVSSIPQTATAVPASAFAGKARSARQAALYLQAFILLQIVCQSALLVEALSPLRIVLRTATFGLSLAALVLIPGGSCVHPARPWLLASLVLVTLGLVHPNANTLLSGVGQIGLYVAIAAPIWWACRLNITPGVCRRVLLIYWMFYTLGAGMGVLQATFPGRFQPALSKNIKDELKDALKITLASGERVYRPMGLTDYPGGAAAAGVAAVLFSLAFLTQRRSALLRWAALGSMMVGLFCLFMCQVRSSLVLAGINTAVYLGLLLRRGELGKTTWALSAVGAVVAGSFLWAVSVGGDAVTNRLGTLVEDQAATVYYRNRGQFLDHTLTELLPAYPLGAGLGRWGMINQYFADNSLPESYPIWVEIQWTGWLLDGGVPLVLSYSAALLTACWTAWKISSTRLSSELASQGALLLATTLGAIAGTFNYPYFISQSGLEIWLLNAVVFTAAYRLGREARALRAL